MADTTSAPVPESHKDLLERPVIAHIATRRPDGDLQSNPVWFDWDGEHLRISQTRARQKMRNVEHDPAVALSMTDPDNPYRYLEVRGLVERVEDDPDGSLVDGLSERYTGRSPYPYHQPGDERVRVLIRPVGTSTMG